MKCTVKSLKKSDINQDIPIVTLNHHLRPDAYQALASFYDVLELDETGSTSHLNRFLKAQFQNKNVSKIADVCCGTGAQSLELFKHFKIQASDLSPSMINEAQKKLAQMKSDYVTATDKFQIIEGQLEFKVANMMDVTLNECQALIAMYNGVGHLSLAEFKISLQNWYGELKAPGIIVFDFFSLDYFKSLNESEQLDFDQITERGHVKRWVKSRVKEIIEKIADDEESELEKPAETLKAAYLDCSWRTSINGLISYETTSVRLYTEKEVATALVECGFGLVGTKKMTEGDVIIVVAQKN